MIKIFFNPLQTAARNESFSPSATKPTLVAQAFSKVPGVLIESNFPPATKEMLSRVHDPDYVNGILNCSRPNGFGNTLPEVAQSLPWTSGSMLAAALYAIENRTAAGSLTSGFHHAGYSYGHGFCTFNGLMVTAVELLKRGYKKIGILDLDAHLGDGTHDIIKTLKLENKIVHYTFGAQFGSFKTEASWLDSLPELIVNDFSDVDIILYQAGADPHEEDPLGGYLSTEAMTERDAIVFLTCRELGIPVAWNLAGGYQKPIEKVIALHLNTLHECLAVYSSPKEEKIDEPSMPLVGLEPVWRKTYKITRWIKWDQIISKSAEDFREKTGVRPNLLLASEATLKRIDLAAYNSSQDETRGSIRNPSGVIPDATVSLEGFKAGELNLDFCIKDDAPTSSFILVYDANPEGGLPLPEEDNVGEDKASEKRKRKVA